ncbi:MAG: ABC transporter ATP-binding protein/permease [Bacteroidales bacterium]|jgi:ABC-type multidrug transport system fused ATPase/permease subunit|nr:ABC transporter ATP-binding protein/permease [Bacteroidales bacterium]
MFKNSFFYKYLSPNGGLLLFNVLLRMVSAVLMVAVLVGVAPVFSLLFGVATDSLTDVSVQGALMQNFIGFLDSILAQMTAQYGNIHTLLAVTAAFVLLFFLKNIFDYFGLYTFTPVRTRAVENIRNDLYNRLLVLPLSFFFKNKRGDLLSRMGSDVQEIDEAILKSIGTSIADIVMFIGLVTCLFLISPPLAGAATLALPLAAWLIGLTSRSLKRKSPAMQAALGRLTAHIEESMRGVKTILAYNNVPHSTAKFKEENEKFTRIKTSVYRRTDLGSPVSEVVGTFFIVLLLVSGGWLIFNGGGGAGSNNDDVGFGGRLFTLKPEAFIVFLLILVQLITPAKNLANSWFNVKRGRASVARIKEVLRADEVITQAADALPVEQFNESIEFKNVWFWYDSSCGENCGDIATAFARNNAALKGISITIHKGQHIAFAGLSGSGKSTLINLIPRFYDPTQGAVFIDGKNVRNCRINDIRALSSLISQDTILFNDTFYNNIRFGRDNATREEIEQAAKKAYAHSFIMATEKGYDTIVGNSGLKLSGGERQRISIARALLKDAPVLILDEASASLDTQAEQYIQSAVAELKNKTIITIAHRLSTIRNADCIYVMEHGNIVESGTHEELAAANGVYKKLLENKHYGQF